MNDNKAPYFGFLDGVHPTLKERAVRNLSGASIDKIGSYTVASDVVEEIVRLGGAFYTSDEIQSDVPFELKYDDVFYASFKCGDSYRLHWCCLTVYQYSYGVYLTRLISEGRLTVEELNN